MRNLYSPLKLISTCLSLTAIMTLCSGSFYPVIAGEYYNLALNPNDIHDDGWVPDIGYPHATSNTETRGEAAYYALNVINGNTDNSDHGVSFPSWGPDTKENPHPEGAWLNIAFGKPVLADSVIIYIRADFPHDGFWHTATLIFSDSSEQVINMGPFAEPQKFAVGGKVTEWVTITNLIEDDPPDWCGLTEVQVWGWDAVTGCTDSLDNSYNSEANIHDVTMCSGMGIDFENNRVNPVSFHNRTVVINTAGQHKLRVIDLNGKEVFHKSKYGESGYQLTGVPVGTYIAELKTLNKTLSRKITLIE